MNGSFRNRLCAALAALVAAGCAEQQAPIDRVQPNYFDKSFFVGKNYLDASDDPEFYSQGTLVDVGYGAGQSGLFTSTYAQPLSRVKWTVQEDILVARLAYERVENSDGKGLGKATQDGIVVAAYKILSHFDVQRQYNPTTGEQLNVVEENTVDRPWYERQYIRVDWSKNLSTDNFDYDTLAQLGVYGGVVYEPLSYYVNDPQDPDAPHFDAKTGYLDVTNKAFARPQMVDLSRFGAGMLPACFFDADFSGGAGPATGCAPVELTIRQSFRRVEQNDYEPQDWDGYRFQAYGAFVTERFGYTRNYGMTDTQWHRFINRYDIWERSHYYDDPQAMTGAVACFTPETTPAGANPHRDDDLDGTEDECAAVGRGSRCDTFKQKCTLPYRDRQERPVVWYYSNGSNTDYFDATRRAAHDWDVALRSAVLTARYAECQRTQDGNCEAQYLVYRGQQDDNQDAIDLAREVDDCRGGLAYAGEDCDALADALGAARGYSQGVIELAKLPEMVVLCHSPVETTDPAACGGPRLPEGFTAAACAKAERDNDGLVMATCRKALNVRRGDLRYHQVNAITTPQTPSPWGIMVDSNDPLTGEVVAASINVWTHVNDLWSQGLVDMARYIRGELETSDVTNGTYIRDWASAAAAAGGNGSLPKMTLEQRDSLLAEMVGLDGAASLSKAREALQQSPVLAQAQQLAQELSTVRADAYASSSMQPTYEARRRRALNTPTEAALTTKMMQSFAGVGQLDTQSAMEFASPLRGANPNLQRELRRARQLQLAERGACILHDQDAPAPFAIADLAKLLEEKFGAFDKSQSLDEQLARAEKMRLYLAQRAHYAVTTHEMGHSMGLRHNFVSSSDPFNYRPQYWQLRTDDGKNTAACTLLSPTGACVGPRYLDPVNDTERENLITMFMQSSTMDYAGDAAQDFLGLGAYDFAAARMFYGDVAAIFADTDFTAGTPRATGVLSKLDNFGGILGFQFSLGVPGSQQNRNIHYSQLQKEFRLIQDCQPVDVEAFRPASWNDETQGTWHPLLDGLIVKVGGQHTRCRQRQVDYVPWTQLRNASADDVGFTRSGSAVDTVSRRVRVPYGFATDRWADLGNLSVYRHDNGADAYELFDFLITQQEVNHIFDNYRRNRQTFSVRQAAMRSLGRYNEKLRDAAKGLGLISNIYRDFAQALGYDYEGLWPVLGTTLFGDNLLASALGFDHFAKILARPEPGPHSLGSVMGTPILRSNTDTAGNPGAEVMSVPNGATGYFGNVSPGGKPLENSLAEDKGEYDAEFTMNAGSYYEKAFTAMLMTESFDNFISDSRRDFLDARYRAVSIADVFPDGYRRWLSTNLTGDEALKGPRVLANGGGQPQVDAQKYPTSGLGWTAWWKPTPDTCFQQDLSLQCAPTTQPTVAVDPQVGWEQQKFLIAWTLLFLPENQQQQWLNMMGIWELGADSDPGFANRIELHLPDGKTYIAKTYGTEVLGGKTVQRGIAARVLQWANDLMQAAYVVNPGPDLDSDGNPDWFLPTVQNGKPVVKYDPTVMWVNANGSLQAGRPGCNAGDNSQCTCSSNNACIELSKYSEVPFFMRQAMADYGLADPSMRGIY